MRKDKCERCGICRDGKGLYYFNYLKERVWLCDYCTQKVIQIYKGEQK